jgi:hypothetical protein
MPITTSYAALHDGLSDMIEGGRITREHIPDDYEWLVESLAGLANAPSPSALELRAALQALIGLCDGASNLAELPPMKRAIAMIEGTPKHETMIVLVISTEHITRSTMMELEAAEDRARLVWSHGCIVFVPTDQQAEDNEAGDNADLVAVFSYCRAHGYEWVRFDSDGPTIDGLPVYEW